jgi:hypothetical protein
VRRPGAAQPYPLPTSPSFSGSLSPPMSPLDPHSRRSSGGFFSPVSAWADPGTGGGREPSQLRDSNGNVVSFHRPFSSGLVAAPSRRGKARRQATLTAMVVGPSGAGKTR